MSKKKKIIAISAGALTLIIIGTVIVVSAIFPGLGFYLTSQNSLPSAQVPLRRYLGYDAQFTAETQVIEFEGVTAQIPEDFRNWGMDWDLMTIYISNTNEAVRFTIWQPQTFDFDPEEDAGFSGQEAAELYATLGLTPPETMFDLMFMSYTLTWNDFNFRHPRASEVFSVLAQAQNADGNYNRIYYLENEHIRGFIYAKRYNDGPDNFIGNFFMLDDGNLSFSASVFTNDDEMAWAFFNSIRV
jgi:hypothetical protein